MTCYHLPVPPKCDTLSSLLPEVKIQYGFRLYQMCILTLFQKQRPQHSFHLFRNLLVKLCLPLICWV